MKRVGESKHPCLTPTVVLNQSGLAVEAFYDFDQVGVDVVQLHGGPNGCMPFPVKHLLKIYKDMIEVLMVLVILLT